MDPANLARVNAVYQFELSGGRGGVLVIKLADGSTVLEDAAHDNPNIITRLLRLEKVKAPAFKACKALKDRVK